MRGLIVVLGMKLIADSGSTKTAWKSVGKDGQIQDFSGIGFNPYILGTADILEELKINFPKDINAQKVEEVFFYGAGCSSVDKIAVVERAFEQFFPQAKIMVDHDLLGAARALCGKEPGIACILGTGSNSCYFDGETIVKNVRALGYILGDEGSGAYMGKQLVKDYLDKELPEDLRIGFDATFAYSDLDLLEEVYKGKFPNTFLASFARFISQNEQHPYCGNLIDESFRAYRDKHIVKYEQSRHLPIHFVGSVACGNESKLQKVLAEKNLVLGKLIKTPIDGLVEYHG